MSTYRSVNKNDFLRDKMKVKILKKAFDLMGRKSIKEVSMREIANACEVTKPTLYYYFKDKDEICYEIMKSVMEKQINSLKEYKSSNKTLKEIFFDIFKKTYKIKGQKSLSFFLHFVDYVRTNSILKKRLMPFKQESDKQMIDILEKEAGKKTISKNKINLGFHLFQACVNHVAFVTDKIDSVSVIDMAQAVLAAIGYKEEKI